MKTYLIFCLCLLPALLGCDTTSVEEEALALGVIAFEIIEEAGGFAVETPGTQVIRGEGAWTALWDTTWVNADANDDKTPPPAIDFSRKMVIAVYWGGGFLGCPGSVEAIETIVEREGEIIVVVGPLPDLGGCETFANPIQMVQIDQSDFPVVFEGEVPGS